jgi:hypothetical protein
VESIESIVRVLSLLGGITLEIRRLARILITTTVVSAAILLSAGVAFAGSYPGGNPPPPIKVGGITFPSTNPLQRTGSNTYLYLIVAAVVLVIGVGLRIFTRTRAARSAH